MVRQECAHCGFAVYDVDPCPFCDEIVCPQCWMDHVETYHETCLMADEDSDSE